MSNEKRINERRNWKAEVFPYDYYIPDNSRECLYCLTEKQAEILRGIVIPMGWKTRWWSDDNEIDQDSISQFSSDIIRRLMMSCCDDGAIYSYNSDGELEVSYDGGETYEPAPNEDIRQNPKVIFPEPPTEEGVDEICLASDGMVNLIREGIGDNLTEEMSRYTLGELIRNWVETMIGTSNPFTALVTIITNQIFALAVGLVIAALTDSVYEKLRCIFSANMDTDKSFTVSGWESVRNQTLSQISGIAGIFLEHIIYLLGAGGLTNLARSMAGTDDSACCPDCNADNWDIVTYSGNNVGILVSRTSNTITVQGTGHPDFGTPYNAMIQTMANDICCVPTAIELISGTMPLYFGVECGNARWPGSPNGPVSVGVSNVNTIYLRGDTDPFVAKITFA